MEILMTLYIVIYQIKWKKRNKFIENLCKTIKGNTLVLFQLVDKHGVLLYNEIKTLDRKKKIDSEGGCKKSRHIWSHLRN